MKRHTRLDTSRLPATCRPASSQENHSSGPSRWRPSSVLPLLAAALAVLVVSGVVVGVSPATSAPLPSSVSEFQPNLPSPSWGGRTIAIDVDPGDPNVAIAAAESGGLFKTLDGGATWKHIDSFVPFRMMDVKYAPSDRRVVIATAVDSKRRVDGHGIFRSTDGGATWQKPANADGACKARPNAYGIAFEPSSTNVYVGTECGVAVSHDLGATWTHVALERTRSVSAAIGGIVDTCGVGGHRRSTNSGGIFGAPTLINGKACFDGGSSTHTIAVSPLESNVLFVSLGAGETYESDDGGTTWTNLNPPTNAMREPYAVTHRSADGDANHIDLYAGGGNNTVRQTCTGPIGGPGLRCSTSWTVVNADHADQAQVAFTTSTSSNCALYLVSDGGVHKTSDCGASFKITGGGAAGYNALQVYEVAGQVHPDHTDLYFGTQDNSIHASPDNGATWPGRHCCEGWWFQMPHFSASDAGQTITGESAGSYPEPWRSGAHFAGLTIRNQPDRAYIAPFLIEPGVYVQFGAVGPVMKIGQGTYQLYLATDNLGTWNPVAGGAIDRVVPERYYVSGTPGDPTLYVPVFRGVAPAPVVHGLVKVQGIRSGNPVTVTAADTGLTDIDQYCNGQGTFRCPVIMGVDPNDPQHLIVADRGTDQMMVSVNGGTTWAADQQLTDLVTANGAFDFDAQVHTIAFNPTDSNVILVGTDEVGIIASLDGGKSWAKMIGSERIPNITSFFFDEVQKDIVVSSYGRGLWKLALPTADLAVTKTHRPDPATAGQELYYDVTVSNSGPDPAPAVVVADNLPAQVTFVSTTLAPPATCSANIPPPGAGQTVTCSLGDMAAGASVSFTIKVAVDANALVDAGSPISITNKVTVRSAGATDPSQDNNTAVDTVLVEDLADLKVTKLCKPDQPLLAGETATCTIYVDNLGPSDARSVTLTDANLSVGTFTIGTVTTSQGSCSKSDSVVTCNLGNLAAASPSVSGRATVTVDLTANEATDINDVATAVGDTPDPDTSNNQAQGSVSVTAVADLSLTKSDSPDPVVAGTNLTYTANVTNNGPSTAVNVVVEDVLPVGMSIISVSGSGASSCNAGTPGDPFLPTTCTYDSLAPGASRTMTINATVLPDTTGILHNDARVFSATFDNNNANDLAHSDTAVQVQSDVTVSIAATPNPVVAGTALSYQITVGNAGPSTATGLMLTDPLPSSLTLTSTSVSGGPGSCGLLTNTNTVQCQLGSLDPGQNVVVYLYTGVSPSAPDGSTIVNTATIAAATPDPSGGNNSSTMTTSVNALADLGITLSSDKLVYKPSTVIHYTITVVNAGPSDALNVVVTQVLPPPKTGFYVSNNAGCPAPSGGVFTCALGTIPAGGAKTFQLNYLVRGNKGTITQTATVNSSTIDPNLVDNSSMRVVTVK